MNEQKICPCVGCTRVPDPEKCDNKDCKLWRKWFLANWELIHGFYLKHVPAVPRDPCESCQCPADMCFAKCPQRLAWEAKQ